MMPDTKPKWTTCWLSGAWFATQTVGGATLVCAALFWFVLRPEIPNQVTVRNLFTLLGSASAILWLMMTFNTALQIRWSPGMNARERLDRLAFIPLMVKRVEAMVKESGVEPIEPFDEFTWTMKWLADYCPALGGPPIGFINTPRGRELVLKTLDMVQSGAYA